MVFEIQADAYASKLQPQTSQKKSQVKPHAPVKVAGAPGLQDEAAPQEKRPTGATSQQASSKVGSQASTQATTGASGASSGTSYVDGLRSWIERHKTYPRQAQRLGLSGQVVVMLEVDRRGFFQSLALVESSTHAILDEAALSLLKGIGSYRPFPDYLKQAKIRVRLPIQYVLN
jgi:protein TonB